jgi:hypothetical protein
MHMRLAAYALCCLCASITAGSVVCVRCFHVALRMCALPRACIVSRMLCCRLTPLPACFVACSRCRPRSLPLVAPLPVGFDAYSLRCMRTLLHVCLLPARIASRVPSCMLPLMPVCLLRARFATCSLRCVRAWLCAHLVYSLRCHHISLRLCALLPACSAARVPRQCPLLPACFTNCEHCVLLAPLCECSAGRMHGCTCAVLLARIAACVLCYPLT